MSASDAAARRRALDGRRSFIVQAPAGSGKTELLIQRYLSLLTGVHEPEQVVAITFTRKAAAEMRARISSALEMAAVDAEPASAHASLTHALASAALARDRERGWALRAQPQRMRIDTLDALNAWLAKQLPVLSGGVAAAKIEESPDDHYARAARRTVDRLGDNDATGAALRRLLVLLDNALPRLESLIAALLPKRDQWLGHLLGRADEALRAELERSLDSLVRETLDGLEAAWPESKCADLRAALDHAAAHSDDGLTRAGASAIAGLDRWPSRTEERLAFWRAAAALLLTGQGKWRRRVTKAQGFGPEHPDAKASVVALLEHLASDQRLLRRLRLAGRLPDPYYGHEQWEDLLALRTVLLQAVAELRLGFGARRRVDFVELALAAQQALGQTGAPSELLLALDRRIQHILVDEFQDTSKTQLRLLELLTAGWQPGDGRSLFLVGDPMQSIYRFRDADMSLFARVVERGIGDLRCEFLELTANFRSAPALVAWVNDTFSRILAARDDVLSAQARFSLSHAERAVAAGQGVSLHAVCSDEERDEIARVIAVLEQERTRSRDQTIAVLVQSRSHLLGLHERLSARGWPVHALEIEAISENRCGQDLLGLTRALSHVGDRIAWLAVLRAPWSGLTWDDLEQLCGHAPQRTIWALMHDADVVARLSPDGQRRLMIVRDVLDDAFAAYGRMRFDHWVAACWRGLGGADCVTQREAPIAERFFSRLAEITRDGGPIEPTMLEAAFANPAAQAAPQLEGGIEIMTIHRAKGLEFDTVVLFGLGRSPGRNEAQALHWRERLSPTGAELVLAPIQRDEDALTRLLRHYEDAEEDSERARVLYVATTRAKERLHLICRLATRRREPQRRSLASWLWPARGDELLAAATGPMIAASPEPPIMPRLVRLERSQPGRAFWPGARQVEDAVERPEFDWAGQTATRIGTVVHEELHTISKRGIDDYAREERTRRNERYARRLALLGVDPDELDTAVARVDTAVQGVLEDPRGRWILGPQRDARSELRLTLRSRERLRHLQLDRTFVDADGLRWIVDYKTSHHEGADLERFIDSEVERYRDQLETYAAAMAEVDARPVRVALYFPLLEAFRDWPASVTGSRSD